MLNLNRKWLIPTLAIAGILLVGLVLKSKQNSELETTIQSATGTAVSTPTAKATEALYVIHSSSYTCENKTNFTIRFATPNKIEIIEDGKIIRTVQENESWPGNYNDGHYAYTFTEGYEGDVIATTMATETSEAWSTICRSTDKNTTGKLDTEIQLKIGDIIRKIDSQEDYQEKTLTVQEFLGHMTDGGGELVGFLKNGQVHKIYELVGLSYGRIKRLYYFNDGNLVFVYEEEDDYPVKEGGGLNYEKLELVFSAGYFYKDGKLVMTNSKGQKRFGNPEESNTGKKLIMNAEKYVGLLSK